jgi:hypothetical protein
MRVREEVREGDSIVTVVGVAPARDARLEQPGILGWIGQRLVEEARC